MNKKYQIGETYLLKVFLEPEEMEYLGEIRTSQNNGSSVDIRFDIFRHPCYKQQDLIAIHDDKFFVRAYDNKIETLVKAVKETFQFEGKGHSHISVGEIKLTIEEFQEQVKHLLTKKEIEKVISLGRYSIHNNCWGEIKWCSECKKIQQTTCSVCGCGSCKKCGHRWFCISPNSKLEQKILIIN